ncbi:MAG: aminopeptidase P family protein [Holosporaceae bacterium]|jgi:Xaa-Pro aminopeptidase|nr:aminopeptidase P family protein [Holosporaceae bacterium]
MINMDFSEYDAVLYRKNEKYPNVSVQSVGDILREITGLEASDGAVVISREKSALFVDGRYALAAKLSVDRNQFEILNLKNAEIIKWIKENVPKNGKIAFDPEYFTHQEAAFFIDELKNYRLVETNLKNALNMPSEKFDLKMYRIEGRENRISRVVETINRNDLDAYLICDPCGVAWMLNIRDLNQKHTPVVLCRALVAKNGEYFLYLDDRYGVHDEFKSEKDLLADLSKFSRVGIDKSQTPFYIKRENFIDVKNPCAGHIKTKEEVADIRLAAKKDSEAITNFLYWFHTNPKKITELEAAEKISRFRRQKEGFIGESFETIAAADENAAIVHYHPSFESNKTIENILLIDSGGQCERGTTDVTRTVAVAEPTEEQKLFYTLVLKGHIALADAKFPAGTRGSQLDSLARQFLWRYSKDYAHSTGHGIGYMSHVHEGPVGISSRNDIPLQAGMILSNEPGYYQENGFGIRLENMMLVVENDDGYLSFETLSLVPFDRKFIREDLLTEEESNWLKAYNRKIAATLDLPEEVFQKLCNL